MIERRKLARERRRNIAVGLTAIAGLGGLVVLLTAFGYVPSYFREGYEVTIYMDDVARLHENSAVTLWGRDIGEVAEVGFSEPGAPDRAYVKLRIDEQYAIPEDVEVRIEKPVFGGGPVVALVGGSQQANTLATDGSAQLASANLIDPQRQLESVTQDITELKLTMVEVGDNINRLFGGEGPGTPSLPRVVLGLEQRLAELQRVMAEAEKWLGDEQLRDDVSQTAKNARELTESLDETVATLEARYLALAESAEARLAKVDGTLDSANQALDGATGSIEAIERRYVALADDAAKVVMVIDKLVARADSKDSTIGLLLSDPQLYHNLTDSSERLKLMVDEARLLMEKWKAEGVPLRVFN
ncbi:MAG: MlaD family protein [Phycisphaeraceae bacterium]